MGGVSEESRLKQSTSNRPWCVLCSRRLSLISFSAVSVPPLPPKLVNFRIKEAGMLSFNLETVRRPKSPQKVAVTALSGQV